MIPYKYSTIGWVGRVDVTVFSSIVIVIYMFCIVETKPLQLHILLFSVRNGAKFKNKLMGVMVYF
jgi:hypothetical protein